MPFYEYVCRECGAQTEKLQKISDPPLTECPHCHRQGLTKVVSAAGFRLKGGGWYETDFKSDNKKNLAADSAAPGSGAGSETAKPATESKPAAAPATEAKPAAPKTTTET